eukprot:COSAG02_NODE_749_length_17699_cov_13.252727_2_plen_454_part_00
MNECACLARSRYGLAPGAGRKAELLERLRQARAADAAEDAMLQEAQEPESLAAVPGLSLPFPLSEISPPPRSRHHSPSPDARSAHQAPAAFIDEAETFSELVYRPHTLTALLFGGGLLVLWGFQDQEGMERKQSWAQGIQACACCFLLYATLQFRDSILMRPHPAFWRFVHASAIIYFLGLVFLFMQPKRWGREWLQAFDSELGIQKPLENTKEYATDCRLVDDGGFPSQVFTDTFFDIFVFSHFVGWFGFALIMRDTKVCWSMSILFEVLEVSAQDVMVNFQECWWDHTILDLCGANALGIYVGMQIVHYYELKQYNWVGLRDIPKLRDKMKRVASQVSQPASFEGYDWDVFSSGRRFACVLFIICLLDAVQLSVFFLKYALWMPPNHWMVMTRTILWVFLAIPACREFYQFTVNDNDPWVRLGPNGARTLVYPCMSASLSRHPYWTFATTF